MLFSLPVLMYHCISDFPDGLCVSPDHFEDQCRTLHAAGWRGISLAEVEAYALRSRPLPRRSLLLTFDDGYLDNHVYAEPILRAYGHCGVIFPVLDRVEPAGAIRPTLEDARAGRLAVESLPVPPSPMQKDTLGYPIRVETFCNWNELRALRERGTMQAAPHSRDHGKVAVGPEFTDFLTPGPRLRSFDSLPAPQPWGMPRFKSKPSLAARAFLPAPELVELVRRIVPQEDRAAAAFLAEAENLRQLRAAVEALPGLGRLESEAENRDRLAREFALCRERFTAELGEAPTAFCWPWGRHTPEALEEAQKAGFRLFFTTRRGANPAGQGSGLRRFRVTSVPGKVLLRKVRFFASAPLAALYGLIRPYR